MTRRNYVKNLVVQVAGQCRESEIVRELIDDLIAVNLEVSVAPAVRETVDAVRELLEESRLRLEENKQNRMAQFPRPITQKLVAKQLDIDKGTASRRIWQAIDAGYLINEQEKQRRPMNLRIADSMPSNRSVLPTAAEVQRVMSCTVAELPAGREVVPADQGETQENSARFEV